MKMLMTFIVFFSTQVFSQLYWNISYGDGSPPSSTDVSLLNKITFDGTDAIFEFADNSTTRVSMERLTSVSFGSTDNGNSLPVELIKFSGIISSGSVMLRWSTATEVDNYGFEIEKELKSASSSVSQWNKIGFKKGNGNSYSPKDYIFIDPLDGNLKLRYRLKQIDFSGRFHYSKIVDLAPYQAREFGLKQNYPNPFNPLTTIGYNIPSEGRVVIKVFDLIGNEIATLTDNTAQSGYYEIKFDASNLSSGLYICRIKHESASKSIKMIVLK